MPADHDLPADSVLPLLRQWFPAVSCVPPLQPLAADASTRRYFRLRWPQPVRGRPDSCVLMRRPAWNPTETPDFLAVGRHLRACGVRVPQVYGVSPAQGLMCLEDFGDCTLAAHWQQIPERQRLRWGKYAIDEIVKMHTVGTQHQDPACPAFGLAFDVPKLLSELQFFRQHAIEGLWQQRLTEAEREALDAAFTGLCRILAAAPRYFCHRDYHGWNIMVHQDGVGVLDFQDARLGPQAYDLVSLLVDRGTPHLLGKALMTALVEYYGQRLHAESGHRIDRQEFTELFEYVAVQRCLKAVGTFAYMTIVQQRQQYRRYIPPTLAYIQPLLERHAPLRRLAQLLRGYVRFETD